MSSLKVAIRLRPLSPREKDSELATSPNPSKNEISITNRKKTINFAFDHVFTSNSSQEELYNQLGSDTVTSALQGYNICIFAYGQTGSGKSYSMMGAQGSNRGIIPRLCAELFARIQENVENSKDSDEKKTYQVEVSYLEIYCERVKDLLNPSDKVLKVREHPKLGPYVDGLSKCAVSTYDEIERLMDEGNKSRTVASTKMNSESSRSHGLFKIIVSEKCCGVEKVSKISLVDLAGSERATKTGVTGKHLREGANINKSLTTLGKVISSLAESSSSDSRHIPYRDSVLTWILKESLGGNAKTVMIATISPSMDNFDETLSTLRYANQAKNIKCNAVINEDPKQKLIKELHDEIKTLKLQAEQQLKEQEIIFKAENVAQIKETEEKLLEAENLIGELNLSWEEKLQKTQEIHVERTKVLISMGVCLNKSGDAIGLFSSKKTPHLLNLNEDPLMSECLLYYINDLEHDQDGKTKIGSDDDNDQAVAAVKIFTVYG